MKTPIFYIKVITRGLITVSCFLVCYVSNVHLVSAQVAAQSADSVQIAQNNKIAHEYLLKNQYDKVISTANSNLALAENTNYDNEKKKIFLYLGKAFRQKKNYAESLKNLLKTLRICENLYDNELMAEVTLEIGRIFQQQKAYLKASEYFNNAYNLYKKNNQLEKANQILTNLAQIDLQLGDRANAYKHFSTLLEIVRQGEDEKVDTSKIIFVLNKMAEIEIAEGDFKNASQRYLDLVKFYARPASVAELSTTYNNLGFVFKRQNNTTQSLEYFNKSLALFQKSNKKLPDSSYAALLENMGVAYTSVKAYESAEEFFKNALKVKQKMGKKAEIARIYNYLAANDYINGNESKAIENINLAIGLANSVNAEEILITSYKILALVYKEDDINKSKEYAEQANRITLNLDDKREFAMQKTINNNSYLEKLENDIKQQILVDEQGTVRFRRLSEEANKQLIENEKRGNDLKIKNQQIDILRKEQEIREIALNNEKLEGEKAQQLLDLMRGKMNYESQQLKLKDTELQVETQKAQEQQQKLVIDEQKRKIQDANRLRERGNIIIVLGSLFFIAVAIGLYFSYRNNLVLRNKNSKIAEQSKDIEQKNKVLGSQNTKISESIRAAQTIQQAILPKEELLASLFADYFVLYRPKDMVSGDFYWVDNIKNKTIIASVDCTGHGVPGAFMSMIGNSLLDKITEKLHILSPDVILNMLDQEIKAIFNKEKLGNEVGMDMAICVISKQEDANYQVLFAGAGQSIYYATPYDIGLIEIKGNSKSIGILSRKTPDFKYEQKEILLERGSNIYFFSDGFADQNNAKKDKIGSQKLRDLLFKYIPLSMQTQKENLENFFANFRKDEPQRDDITVIGIRL